MQNKVPLYPYSAKDAMKRGEIEKWRESFRENCACAGGIDMLALQIKKGKDEAQWQTRKTFARKSTQRSIS